VAGDYAMIGVVILIAPKLDASVLISHSRVDGNDPSSGPAGLGQTIEQAEIELLRLERVDLVRRIDGVRENRRRITDVRSNIQYVSALEKLRMLRGQWTEGILHMALVEVVRSREKPLARART
jgi:hypothetical protein